MKLLKVVSAGTNRWLATDEGQRNSKRKRAGRRRDF